MGIGYYDKDGAPMNPQEWALKVSDYAYKRVGATTLPDGKWISTVWLGLDHSFGDRGPPLIFETMVFAGVADLESLACDRYSTLEEATAGHNAMVKKWEAIVAEK